MSTEPRSETSADDIVREGLSPLGALPPNPFPPESTDAPSPYRFGVRPRLLWALLIANGFVWMTFFTPVLIAMPKKIQQLAPENYTTFYSLTLVIATLLGMFAGPLVGRWSDRSTSRYGRRRPWLFGSMAVGVAGVLGMGFAPDVPVFIVGAVLSQIGFGGTTAVQLSLLPEHVAQERRGKMGGALGVSTAVATVIGVLITGQLAAAGHLSGAFVAVAGVGLLGVLFLAVSIPDKPSTGVRTPVSLAEIVKTFYINPKQHPDFAWGWLSRFMVYLSLASITTFQLFYLTAQIGVSSAEAEATYIPLATAAQVLMTVVGAVVGGPLSDRVGRRKPFVALAAALALVALLLLAFATAVPLYLAGIFIVGLAGGIYASVDIALMTEILPNGVQDAGRDLGVLNIANTLPNTLAPAFAPVLLSIGLFSVIDDPKDNYTMLFLGSAIFALISVFSVLKIRSVR